MPTGSPSMGLMAGPEEKEDNQDSDDYGDRDWLSLDCQLLLSLQPNSPFASKLSKLQVEELLAAGQEEV